MRSLVSLFCYMIVWGSSSQGLLMGADPVKADAESQKYLGKYVCETSVGYGHYLDLDQSGRFHYLLRGHTGCAGYSHEKYGKFEVRDGKVHLSPETPNPWLGRDSISTRYHPVRWDGRMYLVPEIQMVEFCTGINQGFEPRRQSIGRIYLREDDWKKPATRNPQLPQEFLKHLDPAPVHGKIIEMKGKDEAWVDLGADAGMKIGSDLHVQRTGKAHSTTVRILEVEKTKSRVQLETQTDGMDVGDLVSTRRLVSYPRPNYGRPPLRPPSFMP